MLTNTGLPIPIVALLSTPENCDVNPLPVGDSRSRRFSGAPVLEKHKVIV